MGGGVSPARRVFAAALAVGGTVLLIERTVPGAELSRTAARWWPLALICLGIAGGIRLLPAANTLIGPVALLSVGTMALVFTLNPLPQWARPLLLPLALLAAGMGLLMIGKAAPVVRTGPAAIVRRETLVGFTRPVNWDPGVQPLLVLRTLIGGYRVKVLATPTADQARVDIRGALSGIDVEVPRGVAVQVDARGPGLSQDVIVAATAASAPTLRIVVLSAYSSLRVRNVV
ncbi:hypothetical protein GCM10010435_28140 [Winogradskya consettensis]